MELVDGETLTSLLEGGPLSPPEALAVLDQLLDAVGYAHERGVIHRGIKSDNVFITREGTVKLADFGIARVDGSASTATVAGTVLGTPGYMSPEQATGAPVDVRSDLFSVGVLAWELLAGRNPFGAGEGADAPTIIYRIVHEPAPELPESASAGLPADMRPAIMAALSKDPAARPQSAAEFRAMLRQQAPIPVSTMVPSIPSTARVAPARRGAPAWLPYVAVATVALVALGMLLANATSGGGGTAAPVPAAQTAQTQPDAVQEAPVETEPEEPTWSLGVYDGHIAILRSDMDEPYRVSEVSISDLSPETAADLGAGVPVASLDAAESLVSQYGLQSSPIAEASQASSFPRYWSGTFGGKGRNGATTYKDIQISFTQVSESGYLYGICTVGAFDADAREGSGSYYVEGNIDWETGSIWLNAAGWADKGGLSYMRNYSGTVDSSFGTISGSCVLTTGGGDSVWQMSS